MIFIPQPDVNAAFADAIQEYRQNGDIAALLDRMKALSLATEPEALIAASAPYHDLPEVVIPVYERIVTARPAGPAECRVHGNDFCSLRYIWAVGPRIP